MYQAGRDPHIPHMYQGQPGEAAQPSPGASARLQAIHELVRTGEYHVPATAIADRMLERIIVDKREQGS
jgi:anti-sigma28 factor (negative regulator of flagellin synthesis)